MLNESIRKIVNLLLKLNAISQSLDFCAFPLTFFGIEVIEETYLL